MLSTEIHSKLAPLTEDVFDLDARVGEAVIAAERNLETGLAKLRACHQEGSNLEAAFRRAVSNLFPTETRLNTPLPSISEKRGE
jgi:hypothetical protein